MHEQNLSFLSWKFKIFISTAIIVCAGGTAAFFPRSTNVSEEKSSLSSKSNSKSDKSDNKEKLSDLENFYQTASTRNYDENEADLSNQSEFDQIELNQVELNQPYAKNFSTAELAEIEKQEKLTASKSTSANTSSQGTNFSENQDGSEIMTLVAPLDQFGKSVPSPAVAAESSENQPIGPRTKIDVFMKHGMASIDANDERVFEIIPSSSEDAFEKDSPHFAEKPPIGVNEKVVTVEAESIVAVPVAKPVFSPVLTRTNTPRVVSSPNTATAAVSVEDLNSSLNKRQPMVSVAADEIVSIGKGEIGSEDEIANLDPTHKAVFSIDEIEEINN